MYCHGLLISVDCGITSLKESDYCKELGIDLIIVDHHTPIETLPNAFAVINPLRTDSSYPFRSLAAVGVVFNLLIAIRSELRKRGFFKSKKEPDLKSYLDLVALGTVADCVPLVGMNRLLVKNGLIILNSSKRVGIEALCNIAKLKGEIKSWNIAFQIAPRLNAAGRMESAIAGVKLLTSKDKREAEELASYLDSANIERQNVEKDILCQTIDLIENSLNYPNCSSIVLYSKEWHQGVIGIVASRIAEKYHRPTILVAEDENGIGKGSGRSIQDCDLLSLIIQNSEHLIKFGGHKYAAGIAINISEIEKFRAGFERSSKKLFADNKIVKSICYDMELQAKDITFELVDMLTSLEPFGIGNQEPLFRLSDIKVVYKREVGNNNLSMIVEKDGMSFKTIAFGKWDKMVEVGEKIDILFSPYINSWNEKQNIELKIRDFGYSRG